MFASSRNHDAASISRVLQSQRKKGKSSAPLRSPASLPAAANAHQTDSRHVKSIALKHVMLRRSSGSVVASETATSNTAMTSCLSARSDSQHRPPRSSTVDGCESTTPARTEAKSQHWCGACWTDLDDQMPQYQCLECPEFRLCQACSAEASVRHPGHDFKALRGDATPDPTRPVQYRDGLTAFSGSDEPVEAEERDVSGRVDESDDAASTLWVPLCGLCRAKLYDLRYECQECRLNFCWRPRCRRSHPHHALKAITCVERDSDVEDAPCAGVRGARDQVDRNVSDAHDTDHSDNGIADETEGAENTDDIDATDMDDENELDHTDTSPDAPSEGSISTGHVVMSTQDFLATTKALDEAIGRLETKTLAITQSLVDMRALLRAVERAHQHIQVANVPGRRTHKSPVNLGRSLPVELATLPRHDDESEDDAVSQSHVPGKRRAQRNNARPLRQWSRSQRVKLNRLKEKGWSNERIGKALNRSPSAIAQQWRKQNMLEVRQPQLSKRLGISAG